jgi:short-subunit dehydrogenase
MVSKTLNEPGRPLAVITGASSGIGLECARQLHRQGYSLFLIARRSDRLEQFCQECDLQRSGSASYATVDLTKIETPDFEHLCATLRAMTIDLFISNAGVGSFGRFEELPLHHERQMIELNVVASTVLLHTVVPGMKQERRGSIVIVSSVAGAQPLPYMSTYSATKAFNLAQGLALRQELRPFGIQVCTWCPGPVETEFAGISRMPGTVAGGKRDSVEAVVSEGLSRLRRGQALAIPCLRAKMLWYAARCVPRTLSTFLVGRMFSKVWDKASRQVKT